MSSVRFRLLVDRSDSIFSYPGAGELVAHDEAVVVRWRPDLLRRFEEVMGTGGFGNETVSKRVQVSVVCERLSADGSAVLNTTTWALTEWTQIIADLDISIDLEI